MVCFSSIWFVSGLYLVCIWFAFLESGLYKVCIWFALLESGLYNVCIMFVYGFYMVCFGQRCVCALVYMTA
jgi:hypothetical protein